MARLEWIEAVRKSVAHPLEMVDPPAEVPPQLERGSWPEAQPTSLLVDAPECC